MFIPGKCYIVLTKQGYPTYKVESFFSKSNKLGSGFQNEKRLQYNEAFLVVEQGSDYKHYNDIWQRYKILVDNKIYILFYLGDFKKFQYFMEL